MRVRKFEVIRDEKLVAIAALSLAAVPTKLKTRIQADHYVLLTLG